MNETTDLKLTEEQVFFLHCDLANAAWYYEREGLANDAQRCLVLRDEVIDEHRTMLGFEPLAKK
jgi:hypothetical protein